MQVTRFGAFTPAQQVQLDQLTGGKRVKTAIVDVFQPLDAQEKFAFDDAVEDLRQEWEDDYRLDQIGAIQFERYFLNQVTAVVATLDPNRVNTDLGQMSDPAKKREYLLMHVGVLAAGVMKAFDRWQYTPSDRTFEQLHEIVKRAKTNLGF